MKILIVGATGTVGQAVVEALRTRHELICAGSQQADVKVDMTSSISIEAMYRTLGQIDALVVAAGNVHFGEFASMSHEQYQIGLDSKLMGQVNLTRLGLPYLTDGGSVTLTSGILNHDPIRLGSAAAMVNGAIDGFVTSAAIEMPRGIRINAVSPTLLVESAAAYESYFSGFKPVPAAEVALAYRKSIEGAQTGKVYRVGY